MRLAPTAPRFLRCREKRMSVGRRHKMDLGVSAGALEKPNDWGRVPSTVIVICSNQYHEGVRASSVSAEHVDCIYV